MFEPDASAFKTEPFPNYNFMTKKLSSKKRSRKKRMSWPKADNAVHSFPVDEPDINASMLTLTVFKCTICDKNFKKKEYLRDHLKIHSGHKSNTCSYCGETFMHRASLARHRQKYHLPIIEKINVSVKMDDHTFKE